MLDHLGRKGCKGNVLVIPSRDQHDLVREGAQPRDGARGTGGDGIVVIADAVQLAHELDAVLHAGKLPCDAADGLIAHKSVHSEERRHIVFHIVPAGKADVRQRQDLALPCRIAQPDRAAAHERAVGDLLLPREQTRTSDRLAAQIARDGVVGVEDGGVPRALVQVNIFLGRDVLRHVAVHVQMVRGEVRQHRDLRRVRHIHQLERGKLQHRKVVRRHLLRVREQRTADVAAEPHAPSLGLEKLGNNARGGGLAVAAGHADDRTRTDGEERLHLARDDRAVRLRLQQLRHVGPHPGRAEDDVRVQIAQITLAEVQHRAERLIVRRRAAERRALLPVAGDDLHTVPRQQLHERTVAHAEADDRGGLSLHALQIFVQRHTQILPSEHSQYIKLYRASRILSTISLHKFLFLDFARFVLYNKERE